MTKKEYPFFIPPLYLAEKGRWKWSAKEAKDYRFWLLDSIDQRINGLLDYFNESYDALPEELLLSIGEKVAIAFKEEPFSELLDGEIDLTNQGRALAADLGLLVASFLLKAHPDKVTWKTIRKPKRDASYNLPVLIGFGKMYFDPVGGAISEAYGIIEGKNKSKIWLESYEQWSDLVK